MFCQSLKLYFSDSLLQAIFALFNWSLLNHVPFVPTRLRAYVPEITTCLTCLRALNYNVPTRLRTLIFHVPTCLHCYIYFSCLRALNYFVPTCSHSSRAYVPTTTHKIYWGSFLYFVLLFFSELFDFLFHSKPQNKLLLLKLHTQILSCGDFFYLVHCIHRNNNLRTH